MDIMDNVGDPRSLSILWKEAERLYNDGYFQQAEEKYTQYIESCLLDNNQLRTNYNLEAAYNNRGQAKYKLVKFDEAVKDYDTAISYNAEFSVPYYNRGTIHYRLGNFQAALIDIQKSLHLQPNFGEAQIALEKINSVLST